MREAHTITPRPHPMPWDQIPPYSEERHNRLYDDLRRCPLTLVAQEMHTG